MPSAQNPSAQTSLQLSLNALNSKIVQAQSLALTHGISVDEVLARMGGLSEMELGLLRLCAAKEQEARLQATLLNQQQQLQQLALLQHQQQQLQQQQSSAYYPSRSTTHTGQLPSVQENKSVLRPRTGVTETTSWEEDFGNLSLRTRGVTTPGKPQQQQQPQGTIMTPPPSSAKPAGQGKHQAAVSWRSLGNGAAVGGRGKTGLITPETSPVGARLENKENKPFKGFNGVFGNKVVSLSSTNVTGEKEKELTGTRKERSGSDLSQTSSRGSSSASTTGYHERKGTNNSSCSEETNQTGLTTPLPSCSPSIKEETRQCDGYFGSKSVGTGSPGKDEGFAIPNHHGGGKTLTSAMGDSNTGVIGQGCTGFGWSAVVRQPAGPPGGADELGSKNFASRLRQKAVSDLGLLGRRRAQSPAVVY